MKQYHLTKRSTRKFALSLFIIMSLLLASHNLFAATSFNGATVNSAQTICSGSVPTALTLTISTCSGASAYSISAYEWQESADGSTGWTKCSTGIVATNPPSYTPPSLSSTKYYRCKITVTGVCINITSPYYTTGVKITVTSVTAPTANIPTYTGGCSGSTAVFTESSTGSGYAYQWSYSTDGTIYTTISGATNQTYTIPTLSSSYNNYKYKCRVTASSSSCSASTTSSPVTLTVTSVTAPTANTPTYTGGCSGSTAVFTESSTGSGYAYQWSYSTDGTIYTTISGATNQTYTTPTLSSSYNNYKYKCTVTATSGSCSAITTSSPVTLTVTSVTAPTANTPTYTGGCSGSTAVFTESSTGSGYAYQWSYSTDGTKYAAKSETTNQTYTTPTLSSSYNNYKYKCTVTATSGSCSAITTSSPVTLTVTSVTAPTANTPTYTGGCSGSTAVFTESSTGSGYAYQWSYSTDGTIYTTISGATNQTYTTPTLSSSYNNYKYKCTVTATSGSCSAITTSSPVTLTVTSVTAPTANTPTYTGGCSGSTAVFTESSTGSGYAYQWSYSTDGTIYTTISGATNQTYTIPTLSSSYNNYKYKCTVTATSGSCSASRTSSIVTLNVISAPSVNAISPAAQAVCVGDNVSYTVTANASGYLYQWQKVNNSTNVVTNINSGVTATSNGSILTFQSASGDDGYKYQCVVTNSNGCSTTSSSATLSFNSSTLLISSQPSNQSVIEGGNASFSVVASGSGILYYQWQKSSSANGIFSNIGTGGANINGITNSVLSFEVSTADNGYYYRCQISGGGSACPIYTETKQLTVLPGLIGTISLSKTDLSSQVIKYYDRNNYPYNMTSSLNSAKLFVQLDLVDSNENYTLGNAATYNFSETVTITSNSGTSKSFILSLSGASKQTQQLAVFSLKDSFPSYSTDDDDYYQIRFSALPSGTPSQARVQAWVEEDYKVDVLSGSYASSSLVSINPVEFSDNNNNRVTFSWTPECSSNINHYQIQVLRIYNLDETNASSNQYVYNNQIDWSKALSLEVEDATSISLYMAEGTGYYAWRVRPIGNYYEGGVADSRNWGRWSTHTNIVEGSPFTLSSTSNLPNYIFYCTQNDQTKNWNYTRTFTEHNRIAETQSFATGLGQLKQTQRKLAEVDSLLMSAQEYDFVGRPAITSMTAPVNQQEFGYRDTLLQSDQKSIYDPSDFDSDIRVEDPYYPAKTNGATKNVPIWENPRKMYGPISDYFSDANPDINIPSAGNYPYSRTVYDKLGRPKKVSLFGEEHHMGLYDETYIDGGYQRTIRTYYSAVNDTELMGVFGDMTPADTSVYKIIRVDPNEVATVEYKAINGNTIATAKIDASDNQLLDDIYTGNTWYTKVISTQTKLDDYSYVKEQDINFSVPGVDVYVDYWLDLKSFSADCINYCSTCDYIVNVYAIRDETNELKVSYTDTINPSQYTGECDGEDLSYLMPQHTLFLSDPGNYRIGRKISVNNKIDNATRYRDYHSAAIDTLLNTEASKFDELSALVDTSLGVDNLDGIYSFIESLPHGASSACGEASNYTFSQTQMQSGDNNNGLLDPNSPEIANGLSDIWLVSQDDESYTVASGCLEIEIPKISCDWSPCDSIWKTSVPSPSNGYEQDLIDANGDGGYYDFESLLYDKYGDTYGNYLHNYFYDENGNQIYPSGSTSQYQITITSATPTSYGEGYASTNSTNRYSTTQYIDQDANPTFTINIDPDGPGDEDEIPFLSPISIVWNLDRQAAPESSSDATQYGVTVENYVSQVASWFSSTLSLYPDYNYTVSYTTASDHTSGTITISSTFSKMYPNFLQTMHLSNISGLHVSETAITTTTPACTDKFRYGNGYINTMLNHMLHEENNNNEPIYGDCYDMYFKWEDFVNNWEIMYGDKGSSTYTRTDFLQALTDEFGTIYSGFSNHPYGITSNNTDNIRYNSHTEEYGYGYLEYAYKAFPFDTIDWNYNTYIYTTSESAQISNCVKQWGLEFDRQPIDWDDPQNDEESTHTAIWNSECGPAWWDGSNVLADRLDEGDTCKAWKNFYGCLQSDFEDVDNYILGDETTFTGSITDAVVSKLGDNIIDSTNTFLEKRKSGFKLKVRYTDATISKGHAGLYADLIITNVKSNLSSLHINTNNGHNTGVGSTTQINAFKNVWMHDIDFQVSNTTLDASYTHISAQPYNTGALLATWLNNKLSKSTSTHSDDINNEINNFIAEFGIASNNVGTKTSKLNTSVQFNSSSSSTYLNFTYNASTGKLSIENLSSGVSTSLLTSLIGKTISTYAFNYKFNDETINSKLLEIGPSIQAVRYRTCDPRNVTYVYNAIQDALSQAKECRLENSLSEYDTHCTLKRDINDRLKIHYRIDYHQFTLFYYDMAGNLVKTIPPAGIDLSENPTRNDVKNHKLATEYAYNSMGQQIYENSPDGGEKRFWYNELGQLRFSQNDKQKILDVYSYLKYDNLGRVIEGGESSLSAPSQAFATSIDDNDFPSSNCTNQIVSVYDQEVDGLSYISGETLEQKYLQNRISYAYSDPDASKTGDETYTYYSYDPHGNVEWMLQNIPVLGNKYIAYEYDLISGKVTKVKYNEGKADQFFHRYTYDSDNRIEKVETSRDGYIWDTDASYQYYAYGPLKRLSIGEDKIQGLDYVYTINGWLKGINHPSLNSAYDPGADGASGSVYAADVFGTSLGYFEGDFKRKHDSNFGTTTYSPFNSEFSDPNSPYYNTGVQRMDWYRPTGADRFPDGEIIAFDNHPTDNSVDYKPLFNGTITNMVYNTVIPGSATFSNASNGSSPFEDKAQGFKFKYDELYRITQANYDYYSGSDWYKKNLSTPSTFKAYSSSYTYDRNGNIQTLSRYGTSSSRKLDDLTYHYKDADNDLYIDNNQLNYISETASTPSVTTDLENQSIGNYTYDALGELTDDNAEGITDIKWTPSGKVDSVSFSSGKQIAFEYDAMGNKVAKKEYTASNDNSADATYYVNDAKGNVIAIYSDPEKSAITLTEVPLYAASKIGEFKSAAGIDPTASISTSLFTRTVGEKYYEINDHLGNVRAIVNDVKNTDGTAIVNSASDYYPFGMIMPGRDYSSSNYRFGYQGKERDDAMKSNGNSYDFGARILDPRVGRWLSTDPLAAKYPSESPYEAMDNNPINLVDPDGKESKSTISQLLDDIRSKQARVSELEIEIERTQKGILGLWNESLAKNTPNGRENPADKIVSQLTTGAAMFYFEKQVDHMKAEKEKLEIEISKLQNELDESTCDDDLTCEAGDPNPSPVPPPPVTKPKRKTGSTPTTKPQPKRPWGEPGFKMDLHQSPDNSVGHLEIPTPNPKELKDAPGKIANDPDNN